MNFAKPARSVIGATAEPLGSFRPRRRWPISYRSVSAIVVTSDVVTILLCGIASGVLYHLEAFGITDVIPEYLGAAAVVAAFYVPVMKGYDLYSPSELLALRAQCGEPVDGGARDHGSAAVRLPPPSFDDRTGVLPLHLHVGYPPPHQIPGSLDGFRIEPPDLLQFLLLLGSELVPEETSPFQLIDPAARRFTAPGIRVPCGFATRDQFRLFRTLPRL